MSTRARNGFTIVEVMLFLAITGALAVGILVGSVTVINQQRYRDSVNSLKSLIQEQYGQAANVVSSEAEKSACSRIGSSITFNDEILQARGTSDCLVMGRFLYVESTRVTAYSVIGRAMTDTEGSSDTTTLQNYAFATTTPEVQDVAWGARIVEPGETNGLTAAILLLRSPLSGSILTYIESDSSDLANIIDIDGDNHTPAVMIDDANMAQKDFCLDSGGISDIGGLMAVRINARASGQSAVEVPPESQNVCD